MPGLRVEHLNKKWKKSGETILNDVSLEIREDEFFVLLGPSGCGKSTLLRTIAGLVTPDSGRIFLDDRDITDLEPQSRGVGMVFQNYALFPHMDIEKNISFPLKVAHTPGGERKEAVRGVLEKLEIGGTRKKLPHMLSGGERQRAAMGRAMVKENRIYLFDEPLSNLDESLRSRLRPEIRSAFLTLKVPFLYVTHDQIDAMTLGTKIAVMNQGSIVQTGTPRELYEEPENLFVAQFLGSPAINLWSGTVETDGGKPVVRVMNVPVELPQYSGALSGYSKKEILVGIRPEEIFAVRPDRSGSYQPFRALLTRFEQPGNRLLLYLEREGAEICLTAPIQVRAKTGEELDVWADRERFYLFDPESGRRLEKA